MASGNILEKVPVYSLKSRRYIGSKSKLLDWIYENVSEYCPGSSFLDIFAGTGVVSERFLSLYDTISINDFLSSNHVIYKAFFDSNSMDIAETTKIACELLKDAKNSETTNYFSDNFGGKFFGENDARIIGEIRQELEKRHEEQSITEQQYNVLLASLVYSMDRISNTVGHYDAYIKGPVSDNRFDYGIIESIDTSSKKINIYQQDANLLANTVGADVVFIDPPYNSRQYSRFYHVLENVVEWEKPKLYGTALKPEPKNMSDYCRNNASHVFEDLIMKLKCKYIVATYNNTFNSKSSSSRNKITLEQIEEILKKRGNTRVLSKDYKFFNSGKTQLDGHKEYLFITEVEVE